MNQKWENDSKDGERAAVTISKEYDFPRQKVLEMLTDEKKAVKVWGPEGAVKHVFKLDPRPGGAITIHDGDKEGIVAKTSGTILEFVAPELFAFRSVTSIRDMPVPFEALQTVTFTEIGPNRTRVTVLVKVIASGSFPGGVESLEEGFMGGWGETFDMLQRGLR